MAEEEREEGQEQGQGRKGALAAKAKETVSGAKETVSGKASGAQAALRDGVWKRALVPVGAGAAGLLTAVVVRKGPDFLQTVLPRLKESLPEGVVAGDSRREEKRGGETPGRADAARKEQAEPRESMQLTDALDREAARRAREERRRQRRESLST